MNLRPLDPQPTGPRVPARRRRYVAKAAGVGVGTLYRRFPDRDDLILAVYQARMDAAVALAERSSTAADRGFRELVLGGLTDALGWSRSGAATSLSQAIDRMNTAVSGHLTVLLQRATVAGARREDVAPTDVQLINAAVQSVAGVARPGIHHRLIAMIVGGLRPRDDSSPMAVPPLTEEELSRAVRTSARDDDRH